MLSKNIRICSKTIFAKTEIRMMLAASIVALACLAMPAAAFSKRGVTQAAPVLCDDLSSENGSYSMGWFTDWSYHKNSFANSGCGQDAALHPNIDYVPQFSTYWALNPELEDMDLTYVNESKFAMGYNEPDHDGSWIPTEWAAEQWVRMEQLQDAYGLEIVGPCVSNYASGLWWLNTWQQNCTQRYGRQCKQDYVCVYEDGHHT